MKYGIDLDSVLVDFHAGFIHTVNLIWPNRIPPGTVPTDWDLKSFGLSQDELNRVWAKVRATRNWWMTLPALTRNVGDVFRHRLEHPEDEIFYVTARTTTTEGLPIMHQSQRWLEMCGIGGVGTAVIVVPSGIDKDEIYDDLHIYSAIDDSLDVVRRDPGIIKLLDAPWNQKDRPKGITVVRDLGEFFRGGQK